MKRKRMARSRVKNSEGKYRNDRKKRKKLVIMGTNRRTTTAYR